MNYTKLSTLVLIFLFVMPFSQEANAQGHTNQNKFRQLYDELATPNVYRTASGAPGPAYYQQQADYDMDITIDDENQIISELHELGLV